MKDYEVEEGLFELELFPSRDHLQEFLKEVTTGTPISDISVSHKKDGQVVNSVFSKKYPEFYQMVVSDRALSPNQFPFSKMEEKICSALFEVIVFCREILLDRNKVAAKEILDRKLHSSRNDPDSVKGAELERVLRAALPEAYSNRSLENRGEVALDGEKFMEKVYDHIRIGEEESEKIRNEQKKEKDSA